ncbi:unnamed protein product [Ectocarpus sp. 4 AP-2014]
MTALLSTLADNLHLSVIFFAASIFSCTPSVRGIGVLFWVYTTSQSEERGVVVCIGVTENIPDVQRRFGAYERAYRMVCICRCSRSLVHCCGRQRSAVRCVVEITLSFLPLLRCTMVRDATPLCTSPTHVFQPLTACNRRTR